MTDYDVDDLVDAVADGDMTLDEARAAERRRAAEARRDLAEMRDPYYGMESEDDEED